MLILKLGSQSAIIVLHEIYGINEHISGVCNAYFSKGYDVYCPNSLGIDKPFLYSQQEEAYAYFKQSIGFKRCDQVNALIQQIRPFYRKIILLGFSIGATMAWICGESGLCDGIISYYGSRIRDYLRITPKCPTLLLFASQEKSFDSQNIVSAFENKKQITFSILSGAHGFCDPFSLNFHQESAKKAEDLAQIFLDAINR